MPFDPLNLQRACRKYGKELRSAVLCLMAAFVLMLGGAFAALVAAPVDAATNPKVEVRGDTARLLAESPVLAPVSPQPNFSDFPDLFAEFAVLTIGGSPDSVDLGGNFGPARPFIFGGSYEGFDSALDCLAATAWYEAGSDPAGQRSVIQVVLNRVRHPSFPKSVCAVVFQGSERTAGCQFTFTCDGSMRIRIPSQAAWAIARERAMAALSGTVDPAVGQATHYHADYVRPWWSDQLEPLAQVGAHIFYRWPGIRGRLLDSPAFAPEVPEMALKNLAVHPLGIGAIPDAALAEFPSVEPDITALDLAFEPDVGALVTDPRAVVVAGSRGSIDGTLFLELTDPTESGRWAVDAYVRCEGLSVCKVLGYRSIEQLYGNRSKPVEARDRPAFLFLRDPFSKKDVALWDCESFARADPEECLPVSRVELDQLMREPAGE
jgi:Cell Wall Hydrolase